MIWDSVITNHWRNVIKTWFATGMFIFFILSWSHVTNKIIIAPSMYKQKLNYQLDIYGIRIFGLRDKHDRVFTSRIEREALLLYHNGNKMLFFNFRLIFNISERPNQS